MDKIPFFERAPVVERVLGIQFQPVTAFHAGLLGAFWKTLGDEWPSVTDAGAIEPQFVDFGGDRLWGVPQISFRLMQSPPCRLQILNRQGDRMIQLQNGRFHLNWKGAAGPTYPRFPQICSEFKSYFERLSGFLLKEVGVEPVAELWEVTYLNHLPKGTVWNDANDWASLFPPLIQSSATSTSLPSESDARLALETFGGTWQYEISPKQGRLHVELSHGRHARHDVGEVLILTLTARGMMERGTMDDICHGLSLGRFAIAHAFMALTSSEAHTYWGLQT